MKENPSGMTAMVKMARPDDQVDRKPGGGWPRRRWDEWNDFTFMSMPPVALNIITNMLVSCCCGDERDSPTRSG